MGFLNLKQVKLHNSRALVQLMKTRDIVLCHYSQPECSMISEDLYWIEKNIGEIRYVAIWNHEAKLIPFENIILERPVVEQKQKVEGEGEDKQE